MKFNEFILDSCSENLRDSLKSLSDKIDYSNRIDCSSVETVEYDRTYPVHYFAFSNDWVNFLEYYKLNTDTCSIDATDLIGNTPIIIAAKRGHKDFIDLLIFLNADVTIKNNEGWSAIAEGISYGNIKIVENLLRLLNSQSRLRIIESKSQKALTNKGRDFIVEFSWDIKTWIPILSKFLPSDKCKLTKSGSKLRLDQTLSDFTNQKWCRGNISCIINPILKKPFNIYVLDNDKKQYIILNIYEDNVPKEEILELMTTDIVDFKLDTSNVTYTPKTNFWSFGYNVVKKQVGDFEAQMYDMSNLFMNLKQRREHLSKKQIEYNKLLKRKAKTGNFSITKKSIYKLVDLEPPKISDITWTEYKEAMMSNKSVDIGRKPVLKTSVKDIQLTVGMSEQFPLEVSEVLDVFEMILPEKKVTRIRELFSINMPPGFPVTIDIPVVPTVTGNISFLSAQVGDPCLGIDEELFLIPSDFSLVKKI